MSKKYSQKPQGGNNSQLEEAFKHNTSIGAEGDILFDAPIEIRDQADLDNYGITWDDCKTLNFHGSEKVKVFFFKTKNRAFAEYQWSYLDTQHSRGYASVRCMIPGKRKAYIRCPDTNKCSSCPHKDSKQAPVISWDGLIETGYEPAAAASPEEHSVAKSEWESIKSVMDSEDPHIAQAFEMKELLGYSVREIAAALGLSEPRIYQLVARAKAIGRAYRQNNG
jgi:hypothetical protein